MYTHFRIAQLEKEINMNPLSRRNFMKKASLVSAGFSVVANVPFSACINPFGANGDIRFAVVGLRNNGKGHMNDLTRIEGVRLVALCDVDPQILEARREELKSKDISVDIYTDVRNLLERKDIDAIVVSTPNHWHAPIMIWACQAGKDVYVEKPVSHNVWEGRQMVETAKQFDRIVQVGTHSRSNQDIAALIEYIATGNLGKIQWIHALWYKRRQSIGRVNPYYPDWLNYDIFCGPSPMVPLIRKNLHYDWHWKWNTGNGDLCNLGIHQFDVARWIAGHEAPPKRIMGLGGRFAVNDAGDTPNTQLTVFDYSDIPIIMENRGLPMRPDINAMDSHRGIRSGVVVQCEGGFYAGYQGGWIWDNDGKRIKQLALGGAENHMQNFIDCVRSRKAENLRAPIETGHISTSSCHYGNISYRLGQPADAKKIRKKLQDYPLASETFERIEKHLKNNLVDLKRNPLTLGPWLTLDLQEERITAVEDARDEDILKQANFLLSDLYRPPYIIDNIA
jgi:predicted dehydrogenase